MRDHGGNIGAAMARFGGGAADWIDLSTGINRAPYPMDDVPAAAWQRLPLASDIENVLAAAAAHYGTNAPAMICAGAQAAIQMIPRLRAAGRAAVLAPSYNEHAATLAAQGWAVEAAQDLAAMTGADLAVVVNPNNPDGRVFSPADLMALRAKVGLLVVDESFADVAPHLSLLPQAGADNLLILRSFGKFWGLAGARLGLVYGGAHDIDRLRDLAGPWPVSGPALHIAARAYADSAWADQTRARLAQDAANMDDLAQRAGWQVAGGCDLFRLYQTPNALAAQDRLARAHIWSRIFPYSDTWLRLGPPAGAAEWARLAAALR
ncbi:MAG: threonine-phosphate decarboxylase CobD [Cypionkella sp.]|nr:threonine-phosphate decarboxylase CobD [Cypionkella sp.]